jgi:hypothetical protein
VVMLGQSWVVMLDAGAMGGNAGVVGGGAGFGFRVLFLGGRGGGEGLAARS